MFIKDQPRSINRASKHWIGTGSWILYLESLVAEDARSDKEIKKIIAMAKAAFMRRGELLRGIISKDLKKRMVKALV